MSQDDRSEWIMVAMQEVEHLPDSSLTIACFEARRVIDHPSKLIPFIIERGEKHKIGLEAEYRNAVRERQNIFKPKLPHQSSPQITNEERTEVGQMMTDLLKEMKKKTGNSEF